MDEDVRGMLQQFIGQTYGELAKLDQNIVGRTQHLRPQSQDFKNVATSILTNIPNAESSTSVQTAPNNQLQPRVQIQPRPNKDQLEFDFDDSATAKNIYNALKRIEDNLSNINNRLQKLEA